MKAVRWRFVGRNRAGFMGIILCLLVIPALFAQNGLVLHYSFDTDDGSTTTDLSGMGNHGTVHNAEFTADGREGGAMFFNGINAYIDAGNAASLQLQSNFTLATWVKIYPLLEPLAGGHGMINKSYGYPEQSRRAYELALGVNGTLSAYYWNQNTKFMSGSIQNPIVPHEQWRHVVLQHDASLSRQMRFFINGTEHPVNYGYETVDSVPEVRVVAENLMIGTHRPGYGQLHGLMDEVMIFDRVLTPAEIASLVRFRLEYSAGANGMVSGDLMQQVEHGGNGTGVEAVADTGYHFVQWSDGITDNPRTDMSVLADLAVEAWFTTDELPEPPGSLDGLVLHYSFDNDPETHIVDSSTNVLHGSVHDAVYIPDGVSGAAISFDGQNYISAPQSPLLALGEADDKTVAFWWRARSLQPQNMFLVSKRHAQDANLGLAFSVEYGDRYYLHLSIDRWAKWSVSLATNQWYHTAFTKSGAEWKVYHDGEMLTMMSSMGWPFQADVEVPVPFRFGRDHFFDGEFLGAMDEIRIYNRALTAYEIGQLAIMPPSVRNLSPADVTSDSALLSGELLCAGSGTNQAEVTIYWGETDGGTDASAWSNAAHLGNLESGVFSFLVSQLTPDMLYYYRCLAQNASGAGWASESTSFTTAVGLASIELHDLDQVYDGNPRPIAITTDPAGLSFALAYDGVSQPPSDAGTYSVVASINEPGWQGSATGTLMIAKADQKIHAGRPRTVYELGLLRLAIEAYHSFYGHYPPTDQNEFMDHQNLLNESIYPPDWEHYVADPDLGPLMPIWEEPSGLVYFLKLQYEYYVAPYVDVEAYVNQWKHYLDEVGMVTALVKQTWLDSDGMEGSTLVYSNLWAGFMDPCGQLFVYRSQPPYQSYTLYAHDPFIIEDQFTTSTVGLAATASSGLPVTFRVEYGPATITDATNLSFSGAGEVKVVASQPGNANWNPAPDGVTVFMVSEAPPPHTIAANADVGGGIAPMGDVSIAHNSSATFTVQATGAFHIAAILVDGVAVADFGPDDTVYEYPFENVLTNHTIEARFNSAPVIGVTASPTEGVAPLRVGYDFSTSFDLEDNIVRSEIDREGNGNFDVAIQGTGRVIVEYPQPGVYTSIVRVVDGFGLTSAKAVEITVRGQGPIARLNAEPQSGTAPLTVELDASASSAATGYEIVVYEWDFDGDGTFDRISTTPVVTHVYSDGGEYQARVRVTDDQGLRDSASVPITVDPPSAPPTVAIDATPRSGTIPLDVLFTAHAMADGEIAQYAWDFNGNGIFDLFTTNSMVVHRYTSVGEYRARVRVMDDQGLTVSDTVTITAREASQLRTWISQPKPGDRVWGENVTVHAQTAPGNLTAAVRLQYKHSTTNEWLDIGPEILPPPNSFRIDWDVTGLMIGEDYDLRSLARDTAGNWVVSDQVTVRVDDGDDRTPGRRNSGTSATGNPVTQQTFDANETGLIMLGDGTAVMVPAGTVLSNPTIIVETPAGNTHPAGGAAYGLQPIGINRTVSIEGNPDLNQPLIIEIPYSDADGDGVLDGTGVNIATLAAFWYDVERGQWRRVLDYEIDIARRVVRLSTYHLTEFALFGEDNLLHPANGGYLRSGPGDTDETARMLHLTDGNRSSYWRTPAAPETEVIFDYGFTNYQGAIITEAVLHNHGGGSNYYAGAFRIETSMDGDTYTPIINDSLPAGIDPVTYDMGGVTGRYVRLVIVDGHNPEAWALSQFAIRGSLTMDADNDGMPDWWEMLHFGDFNQSPDADYDNDGMTNLEEYIAGTDPTNPQSRLMLEPSGLSGSMEPYEWYCEEDDAWFPAEFFVPEQASFRFHTVAGRRYRLQATTNIQSADAWQPVGEPFMGDGSIKAFVVETIDSEQRYFRLIVELVDGQVPD